MRITLDIDGNNCLLEYNRNCPWYLLMDDYSIPIDGGLQNIEKLLKMADKRGIKDFDDLLHIYQKATGLDKPLSIARAAQKAYEYWQSDEAEVHRKIYKEFFGVQEKEKPKDKKGVIMKPENAAKIQYKLVEAAGQAALFTQLRIDRKTVPEGYYCYDLRHGDDDSIAETIEYQVYANYYGAILCQNPYDFGGKDFIAMEDGISFIDAKGIYLKDLEQYSQGNFASEHADEIKVVIIEPEKPPYVSSIKNDYKSMQSVVGGLIEYVALDGNTNFFCNDEGKLIGLQRNRKVNGDIIAGTFFICGDDGYGNSISLTDEQIDLYLKRFAEPEHYTDEQVRSNIHYTIRSAENIDEVHKILFGDNEDDENDLEP